MIIMGYVMGEIMLISQLSGYEDDAHLCGKLYSEKRVEVERERTWGQKKKNCHKIKVGLF